MFEESEKEWILEAINHLKHRKARPDLSRISLRMKRKHQMSFAQTKKLLESLIECGIVVKAVYKNNTSYRDVSQWKKGRLGGQIMNSNRMLNRFIRAIEATEKSKGTGVSAKEIEDFLAGQDEEKCFLSGAALRDALENEIVNGYLKKFSTGLQMYYTINGDNVQNVSLAGDDITSDYADNSNLNDDDDSISNKIDSDVKNLLTNVMKAINETEHSEGFGSSFLDIKEYLLIKGVQFTDDSFLLEFLENNSSIGTLKTLVQDSVTLYSVPEETLEDIRGDSVTCSLNSGKQRAFGAVTVNDENVPVKGVITAQMNSNSYNSSSLGDYRVQSSTLPLRPPSKRKRIVKDHGPDFETEIPTKMKAKNSEIKESVYPTPTASPASERSETTTEQSFKFDVRKKRGRPKKEQFIGGGEPDGELQDDSSKQGAQSEQSSVYNDEEEEAPSYPDIFNWSSQQVADYFKEKGYLEESQNMLENALDGAALGLLKRTDIVGPPLGGMLKITKLGVALKLFRDIRDLLYQGNAENYIDPYEERAFFRS